MEDLKCFFKLRGILMAPPLLFALLCNWYESENIWLTWLPGIFLFSLGILLRLWSQIYLKYRLKTPKQLTKTGPYALVRNPIYIGNTLIILGLILMLELVWFAPFAAIWCLTIYNFVIAYEEEHLLKKYGIEYIDYLNSVPRWIPQLESIKEVIQQTKSTINYNLLLSSILAEIHCFIWLIIPLYKEFISFNLLKLYL